MEDEHKLDGLKFLAHAHRAAFEANIARSFRITYSTLGLFGIVIAAPFSGEASESITTVLRQNPVLLYVLWICFIFIAVVAISAIIFANRAAFFVRRMAERSENEIIDLVGAVAVLPKECRHSNPNDRAYIFRVGIVAVFSVIACFVYGVLARTSLNEAVDSKIRPAESQIPLGESNAKPPLSPSTPVGVGAP